MYLLFTIFSIFLLTRTYSIYSRIAFIIKPDHSYFCRASQFQLCACRSPRRAHKLSCMACDICLLHKNVKHKSVCMCVKTNLDAGANFVEEIKHFPEILQDVWIMYEDLQKNSMWHGRRGKFNTFIRTMLGVIFENTIIRSFLSLPN